MESLVDATIKQIPILASAVIVVVLGWAFGNRLAMRWNLRQKRREIDISKAQTFHSLYGEFFAIWKLWNYLVRDIGPKSLEGASRWSLLTRACEARREVGVDDGLPRL